MEEEKKNNKGLMVGIIIFLIICLVAIFYFMFKMTYVGEKKSQSNENNNLETTETTQGVFTELTKYELQEGEEKEITIGDKKIKLKKKEGKIYLNDEILEKAKVVYITNKEIIITSDEGQDENGATVTYGEGYFKETYRIYDLAGKQLRFGMGKNIRLEENKILYDDPEFTKTSKIKVGDIYIGFCENKNLKQAKKLKEYEDKLKEFETNAITNINEIIYSTGEINIEIYKSKLTIKDMINDEIYCGSLESN